jgi:DNA polymerase
MLIGEAPGEQDDRVGLPFQGSAGVLLRAMLETVGVGADASVFMTNLIKCRPLGNRTPRAEEIAACQPYLLRQIELLQPVRILALGRLAAQALLGADADLERLRGKVHVLESETGRQIPLIVTYHPASLLSRPQHKANAWRDLHLALSA